MQNQGRNMMIAVALALGVMFVWQSLFAPKQPDKKPAVTQGSGSAIAQPTSPVGVSTQPAPAGQPAAPVAAAPRGPEQEITLSFPNFVAKFSSYGGRLTSWHLTDTRYDREKQVGPGRVGRGELVPSEGAFVVNFAASTFVLPAETEWVGQKVSDREVVYTYKNEQLALEKRFVIVPEVYIVKATISVKANVPAGTEARQQLALTVYGFQDPKDSAVADDSKSVAPRRWDSSTYSGDEHYLTTVTAVQKKPRYMYDIKWAGFEHPFQIVAVSAKPAPGQQISKQTTADASGLMRMDLLFSPADAFRSDSQPIVHEVAAYLGPKNYNQLADADDAAGFSTHFVDVINLGWFGFIGKRLMWLLLQFYAFLGNWGLTIMLLTVCVKALTIPLVTKSMRSMKAMAVLAPEMKALQEKYKDDRQRLQMETMALYKQHGANPLTGCLPLLLQMPIWLALYRMLSSTGELYQQPFIPGWIDDLTIADPYHVMPVLLLVTMFVQARLQPMGPVTDPAQKMQQNLMKYGMPLMFGGAAFFFPSGLTLYIFTNTILSALHSIYMNKFDKKSLALQAKIKASQEAAAQAKDKAAAAKAKPANADTTSDDGDGDKPTVRPGGGASRKPRKKQRRN